MWHSLWFDPETHSKHSQPEEPNVSESWITTHSHALWCFRICEIFMYIRSHRGVTPRKTSNASASNPRFLHTFTDLKFQSCRHNKHSCAYIHRMPLRDTLSQELRNKWPATHPEHNALALSRPFLFPSSIASVSLSVSFKVQLLHGPTFFFQYDSHFPVRRRDAAYALSIPTSNPLYSFISVLQPRHIFSLCVCAPVHVFVVEANQPKIAKPPQTRVKKQHTNTLSCQTAPTQSETLWRQLYGPWLADTTGYSLTKRVSLCTYACVCVCVCASGCLMIQQGSRLSKGKSWVREQLANQHCIQHSRSMTCQAGLWITVMDVLINATHTCICTHTHTT